ncbi:MAG: hypothetical protein WBM43_01220 [Flavobacteriaceae bacterium]
MEFYSPDVDLKKTFGEEIKDADYISESVKICEKSEISFQEARFIPHNLLTNWNEIVGRALFGDEDTEDFHLDFARNILFELENSKELEGFDEHRIFRKILRLIDQKLKDQTFIPRELEKEEKWWNCVVFKRGTKEYIDGIEDEMYEKFKMKLDLKNQIEKI